MIVSIVIIALSVAMAGYWFRYTCLLVLQARRTRDFAKPVIEAHALTFREVSRQAVDLQRSLDREYEVLSRLVARVAPEYGFEIVMLRIDYSLMRMWWRITRDHSPRLAGRAASEMRDVLENWASLVGVVAAKSS
jgi:hypothetical protein